MTSPNGSKPIRLDECPHFCRAKVTALGSLDTSEEDHALLGEVIIPWTGMEESDDIFAEVEVRGVVTPTNDLWWLSGDAEVEVIELPRYAGQPEDLIPQAQPMGSPEGVKGKTLGGMHVDTPEGWHPLIWKCVRLHSAIRGWSDPEGSVEFILVALAVAPDIDDLRPTLLAGLKARYARVKRLPEVYPPARYPWRRNKTGPDTSMLAWKP